jgi:hypothetical protein
MALYFVTRPTFNINSMPASVKIIWLEGNYAEFNAWKSTIYAPLLMTVPFSEASSALKTGVSDVYVTTSLANATKIVQGVPGGSLYDDAGILIQTTPSEPIAPPIVDQAEDFVLIARKSLGLDEITDFDGATIISHSRGLLRSASDYFDEHGIVYAGLVANSVQSAIDAYEAGVADAILWPASWPVQRLLHQLADPGAHMVLTMVSDASPVPEHVITIALLYEAGLGREADADGLNYWIDQHDAGMSFATMAANFLDSAEFTTRFGDDDTMSNADFVNVMYLNILNRPGEKAGLDYWTSTMDTGMSREAVLIGFARSPENMQGSDLSLQEVRPGYWEFG